MENLVLSNISHLLHVAAASDLITNGAGAACASNCGSSDINKVFSNLTNALIFLIGSISVIMIIVGGLRYVLSGGDSKSTEGAKNTILYAVVGVIIAISAFGIVKFVSTTFSH